MCEIEFDAQQRRVRLNRTKYAKPAALLDHSSFAMNVEALAAVGDIRDFLFVSGQIPSVRENPRPDVRCFNRPDLQFDLEFLLFR